MGVFVRTRWGGVYGGGGGFFLFIALVAAFSLVVAAKLWWITLPVLALIVAGRVFFDKRYTELHQREHTGKNTFHPTCTYCRGELDQARTNQASQQQLDADQEEWRRLHQGDTV